MQQQIQCPNCQAPIMVDIHQIIDVGLEPQLKQMLMSGAINQTNCPHCQNRVQINSPILYHDPEHSLFMLYTPMGLSITQMQEEEIVGRLIKQAMEQLPAEQRRGYMFNPEKIINFQTFMEKVFATEGITRDMLDAQQAQAAFLEKLMGVDNKTAVQLIQENQTIFDETIFAILQSSLQAAIQQNHQESILKLTNIQAACYQNIPLGKKLIERQTAIKKFQNKVQQDGGLTPDSLVAFIIEHASDWPTLESVAVQVTPALNESFFDLLDKEIAVQSEEKQTTLIDVRAQLAEMQTAYQTEATKQAAEIEKVVQRIAMASDKPEAIRQSGHLIDENFMAILAGMIDAATAKNDQFAMNTLRSVYNEIMSEAQKQIPAPIRLINELIQTENIEDQHALIEEKKEIITPELLPVLSHLLTEVAASGDESLTNRLKEVKALIESYIA